MIIAQPLRDEFCRGHVGRIGRLNGFKGYISTISMLRGYRIQYQHCVDKCSEIELIASVCNLNPNEYAIYHSLLPIRPIIESKVTGSKPMRWIPKKNLRLGMRTVAHERPRLCETCINEDMETTGYSYWRRSHQLPGSSRCVRHDTLLREVNFPNAFDATPIEFVTDSTECSVQYVNALMDPSEVLNTYLEEFVGVKERQSKQQFLRRMSKRRYGVTKSALTVPKDTSENVEMIVDQVKARQDLILSLCKFV